MASSNPIDDQAAATKEIEGDNALRHGVQVLRRSEVFLRDFMEGTTIGLHSIDVNGTILWADQAELDLLGYTYEEYIGRNIAEFHADEVALRYILERMSRGEALLDYPARLRPRDGSIRHALITSSPLFEDGKFVLTRYFVRDVTALHHEQEATDLLSAIVDSSDDAIISKDLNGYITSWNKAAERIFGYTAEEAVGQSITMIIPEDRVDEEPRILARLRRGERIDHFETVRRRKDGTLLDISLTISPVRDRNGRIIGASKIARDITERKRAERIRAQLSAIVESSGDAIYIHDFEGTILTWNRAAEDLYGYTGSEIVGRSVDAIVPSDFRAELHDIINPAILEGKIIRNLETKRLRRDGTIFPALLTMSPIHDEARRVIGSSVIARDISDQKRSEESLRETQKLESLGLLAGGIAHDFNNLLTGVIGNASLLAEEFPIGSAKAERVQSLIEAAERMARLTSQMLAYSGRGHFVIELIDLSKQVIQITNLIQASIPKNVELRLSLASNLPFIQVDISQLQQIIMNLVINAAESIGDGDGLVELKTGVHEVGDEELRANVARTSPPAGDYVVMTVEDTGCGMDETTRSFIFDPFFTTKFTGRGLGLSSVLGIVRGHRGLITVKSSPGAGTRFCVFFPIPSNGRPKKSPALVAARGNSTILLVDDEEIVRRVGEAALQKLGYDVITAVNGRQALEIYAADHERIHLVLLDMVMPVMGGEETLRRLLSIRPDAPVLAMSGFHEREAKRRFGPAIADFVQKPFTAAQLGAKVTGAIRASVI